MTRRLIPMLSFPLVAALLGSIALPAALLADGAIHGGPPLGPAGQSMASIGRLVETTIVTAVPAALTSVTIALTCSLLGCFTPWFRRFYTRWLVALLLTNPILLVFGFSVFLDGLPPVVAVILAGAYILLPPAGLVVESGARVISASTLDAARSLGASPWGVVIHHLLPATQPTVAGAIVLSGINSLGFFLTPRYVGLGRVDTLATVVVDIGLRMGDWSAACQWSILLQMLGIVLMLITWAIHVLMSRRSRRDTREASGGGI